MSKDLIDVREPFKVKDRVFHEVFGKGYVDKVSAPSTSKYYHVEVTFDEPYQVRDTAPVTRFRKLVSTYLEKVDEAAEIEADDQIQPLEVEGLEGTDMVLLNFSAPKNSDA